MTSTEMADLASAIETLARQIAEDAHAGQTDKAGHPYIGHVQRVAERLDDPLDRAVAWLHDVVEDTGRTYQDLLSVPGTEWTSGNYDVWRGVCMDAERLTHRPHETRDRYYQRVRGSARAVRVKLADVADNSDPARLAVLDSDTRERLARKYAKARQALGA